MALLETETASGPYFIDDGHTYTWEDIKDALSLACERRLHRLRLPFSLLRAAAYLFVRQRAERVQLLHQDRITDLSACGWVCSGEKLRHDTGHRTTRDLARGFTETLEFYRGNGWLAK